MRRIVPFNNVLTFKTDVSEITAISLEPAIEKESDLISGNFKISGEYKITDGMVNTEAFNFNLPFDIALGTNYDLDTLAVEVDDFRYELVSPNQMKVNIDIGIDGEEKVETKTEESVTEERNIEKEEPALLDEISLESENIDKEELPLTGDLFSNYKEDEKYVTYRVYRVSEGDTLDNILKKYNISKEELAKYNNLENLTTGTKLIIPDLPNEK